MNDLLSREVEGSGLGLAIVRHVALGHGGRVELNSEPGKGSTFSILIPKGGARSLALSSRPPMADTSPEPTEA